MPYFLEMRMKNSPEVETILYATDLGGQTRPVFRHALALAKLYEAKIIMMHVVEPMGETAQAIVNAYLSRELTEDMQKDTMKALLARMKERLQKFFDDECDEEKVCSNVKELLVVTGKPSEEILRVAEEQKVDMVIVGKSTRKVRGIRVMGSTARRVSRMASIPVLVVPNY
jgi:nucleotide-binding universal stress UspA family protein